MKINNEFLFVGLSHIGQVFSICWAKKFGKASIFDFNSKSLNTLLDRLKKLLKILFLKKN